MRIKRAFLKRRGFIVIMNNNFGSCCSDLKEVMYDLPESFFRVEDNDVLYLTVGCGRTKEQTGYFDHAVLFCPFCGAKLQDNETIALKSASKGD